MDLRLIFTILIAKVIIKLCRIFNLGGTTFPGKIAKILYPDILKVITRDFKIIMVTGTNGKTTTSKMIGQILEENEISYIANRSGANLEKGIISTFIDSVNLVGECRSKIALLEVDEAAFKRIADYISPEVLVVTNFFRDQLDRYGELYTTLRNVKAGISKLPETTLVLNADDSLCASLGKDVENPVIFYGIDNIEKINQEENINNDNNDAGYCLYCKNKYEYGYRIYGHFGGFKCEICGYSRPDSEVTAVDILELRSEYSEILLSVKDQDENYVCRIALPGIYNIYNALAALTCGHALRLSLENSIKALARFKCGFGRMETIETEGKIIKIILVKNPAGFNQVLKYILNEENKMILAFVINDKFADGTDISWLWDVNFEILKDIYDKVDMFYTSGLRAEDMAVRLKYSGVDVKKIEIRKDFKTLLDDVLTNMVPGQKFYILPTYTAMLEIRKILQKRYSLKNFWE